MERIGRIFWLGTKELRSILRDTVILALLVYAFTVSVYTRAEGASSEVHNASIGIVDEDSSMLSRQIASGFYRPRFQEPKLIDADEVDAGMDSGRFMFVLDIPPRFEADLLSGNRTEIQLNIDATAMMQGSIGAHYIQNIVHDEVSRFAQESEPLRADPVRLVARVAFNPNRSSSWFMAVMTIVDYVTMLTIVLTGAALIREREHGTIEHLLVMPLTAFDIAMSKIWANGVVILASAAVSLTFVVEWLLGVPIAGSKLLFLSGTALYLFFASALGVFLGTIARSMAQFALLTVLVVLPLALLSGGRTPVESQPEWLQSITVLLPSRHFVSFSQGILFRGAGFDIVWPQFLTVTVLGLAFFGASLAVFRRSISREG